jgi:hypothetical protein
MSSSESRFWQVTAAGTALVGVLAVSAFDGGTTAVMTVPGILGQITATEASIAIGAAGTAAAGVSQIQNSKKP